MEERIIIKQETNYLLPKEIIEKIIRYLSPNDKLIAMFVCKNFYAIVGNDHITLKEFGELIREVYPNYESFYEVDRHNHFISACKDYGKVRQELYDRYGYDTMIDEVQERVLPSGEMDYPEIRSLKVCHDKTYATHFFKYNEIPALFKNYELREKNGKEKVEQTKWFKFMVESSINEFKTSRDPCCTAFPIICCFFFLGSIAGIITSAVFLAEGDKQAFGALIGLPILFIMSGLFAVGMFVEHCCWCCVDRKYIGQLTANNQSLENKSPFQSLFSNPIPNTRNWKNLRKLPDIESQAVSDSSEESDSSEDESILPSSSLLSL